ncbi:hypothetical protein SAMD00019534_065340 [Acytostelium subglobosum LB1]|uniref:hypothetical protein n=1 Tax=Acytostelium subglobosum LB1 TaxID=1410327 RepID=UPI000644E09D|nr:hypothetical protein SAMD00019534_065340 [Acytostelium subglobosum LB1]GAM23359.1 hypothetical protein SAMD00019534_065340 [Acytostelium subglobosum LB1]|eukprot:XP_012753808.1 hypothetical protein SAMD00019534_065340 [Acytostelium subglobosum LB1]
MIDNKVKEEVVVDTLVDRVSKVLVTTPNDVKDVNIDNKNNNIGATSSPSPSPSPSTSTNETNESNESNETENAEEDEEVNLDTSDRPLAYVERIVAITPIAGADAIETATVRGWNVIVKKALYKPGDLVIYVEIDSVLPPWPYFIQDRLDKCNFKIKTIKMRGQISQGYCIPVRELLNHPKKKIQATYNVDNDVESGLKEVAVLPGPGLKDNTPEVFKMEIGCDVTQLIGIRKIVDHPAHGGQGIFRALMGHLKPFPSFLRKTDQSRIQNKPNYATKYADMEFEITEKLEGSSITAFHYNGRSGVCSRNYEMNFDDGGAPDIAKLMINELKILERLDTAKLNVALQGEMIGPKIQGNIYGIKELEWKCFDVWFIDENRYATHSERVDVLKQIGLSWENNGVPFIGMFKMSSVKSIKEILEMANGFSVLKGTKPKVLREGIVFKSTTICGRGHVISFKSISNQYLLKK